MEGATPPTPEETEREDDDHDGDGDLRGLLDSLGQLCVQEDAGVSPFQPSEAGRKAGFVFRVRQLGVSKLDDVQTRVLTKVADDRIDGRLDPVLVRNARRSDVLQNGFVDGFAFRAQSHNHRYLC